MRNHSPRSGFTIVELLVIIVIIAILAAVVVVAYSGIQQRARASQVSTALAQAKKKLEIYKIDYSNYPLTGSFASAGITDPTIDYQYTSDGSSYCVTATSGAVSYYLNTTGASPLSGGCPGHGQGGVAAITNYVFNPSAEVSTSGWGGRYSAVIARSTAESHSGTASLMVTTPGAVIDEGLNLGTGGTQSSGVAATHTASAWVKAPSGAALRVMLEDYTSANTYIGGAITNFTGTGTWQRVTVSRTTAAATNKFVVNVRTQTALAATYYVDDVMITQGASAYAYSDPNISASWVWNGSANFSTSTGPAS